jgi:chromosome segregation ATPase
MNTQSQEHEDECPLCDGRGEVSISKDYYGCPMCISRERDETESRLEEEIKRLHAANLDCVEHFNAIKAERDELLEALKPFVDSYRSWTENEFLRAMAHGLHPNIHKVHDALKAIAKTKE